MTGSASLSACAQRVVTLPCVPAQSQPPAAIEQRPSTPTGVLAAHGTLAIGTHHSCPQSYADGQSTQRSDSPDGAGEEPIAAGETGMNRVLWTSFGRLREIFLIIFKIVLYVIVYMCIFSTISLCNMCQLLYFFALFCNFVYNFVIYNNHRIVYFSRNGLCLWSKNELNCLIHLVTA